MLDRLFEEMPDEMPDGMLNGMPDGTFHKLHPSLLRLVMLGSFKCRLRLPSLLCQRVRTCVHGRARGICTKTSEALA